ncbi:ESX secretion-associated protein EspG [Nocardia terpenica]|uniref:ESX secretion-associated protein EspG n=1 Tax=Nocardia terpenica TaxID=455432 RepID=UPI0018960716|nr:ESX secretion-associated protein EspG [Nocardia terpenica]MBF6060935.1 ESX secretion-associated protein EspG [Nocardia terpenica]MBF6111431.1 ESX secretion-associated protein EspG [Nocardia terpenica]MBF6118416.1 ESX secretion-associated protein EspG [Nocardia terpenica]MBF6155738.1 ESX secretion-associated protein EspG [Nocardia terpenica]
MRWTLTPDQFALAWERTDGDRIPYPLAVRLSARDSRERTAQLPELNEWCSRTLDPDLEAALRVLARPAVRVEVFGQHGANTDAQPVRVLGAAAGHVTVVAAQRAGDLADRGAEVRLFVGTPKTLAARVVSVLPENTVGTTPRHTAPLARVREDSRDLVTVPVSGPSTSARIRRLLKQPRTGIGQIVVSARRADDTLRPTGVLCWIDVVGDGRYAVRTRTDVDVIPVTAESFAAQLRPMITAAERVVDDARAW